MERIRRQNEPPPQNCTKKLVCIYIANKYVICVQASLCTCIYIYICIYIHVCAHCIHTSNMYTYANSRTRSTSQLSLQVGAVVSSLTPFSSSWQRPPPPISCDTGQTMSQQPLDPAEDLSLASIVFDGTPEVQNYLCPTPLSGASITILSKSGSYLQPLR